MDEIEKKHHVGTIWHIHRRRIHRSGHRAAVPAIDPKEVVRATVLTALGALMELESG
jgi:hypothetical protein